MIPWYAKIPAKIVLSRLPVSLKTWQRLNLFRAGGMDDDGYARRVFDSHFSASGLPDLSGKTILEIGPGNGLLTAKYASEKGAAFTWLIDSEPIAEQSNGTTDACYLTNGLVSLRGIAAQSVDYIFSNAVLEHVRLREFSEMVQEMRRVLKPNGIMSHEIDFRDHLQEALNSYRFSERLWESDFMATSGFYTNRIPWPQMQAIFGDRGFAVEIVKIDRWPFLPTSRSKMDARFRNSDPDTLLARVVHAVFRPTASRMRPEVRPELLRPASCTSR